MLRLIRSANLAPSSSSSSFIRSFTPSSLFSLSLSSFSSSSSSSSSFSSSPSPSSSSSFSSLLRSLPSFSSSSSSSSLFISPSSSLFFRSFATRPTEKKAKKKNKDKNNKNNDDDNDDTTDNTNEDDDNINMEERAAKLAAELKAKQDKKADREKKREERAARKALKIKEKEQRAADKAAGITTATTSKDLLSLKRPDLLHKIKRYQPKTNGIRHKVTIDRSELYKGRPIKALTIGMRKTGGRSRGTITVRHRGGGHKRLYRFIDFKRDIYDEPATIVRLEYDPNRTAHIALVRYADGLLRYILAPQDLSPGDIIMASRTKELDLRLGNTMPLSMLPAGSIIHNVEMVPGKGGQLARSAGTAMKVIDKNARPGYVLVEMASKEQRFLLEDCLATVGSLSNPLHGIEQLGKAGRSRHRGRRPYVRACAMNPVDHPMGGGFNAKGRQPCSPTGILAKGFKTVRVKSPLILVPRGGHK